MSLKKRIDDIVTSKGKGLEGLREASRVVADHIADLLGVNAEEVAILILTTTQKSLKFVWPPALSKSSSVLPADHKSAIASTVLSTKKGKVDNKCSESKHLRFFENVRGMDTSGSPIQKMIALPLIHGGSPLGVLEVSRKGRTPSDAGPDFTPQNAQALVAVSKEVTPLFAKLIPDPFL